MLRVENVLVSRKRTQSLFSYSDFKTNISVFLPFSHLSHGRNNGTGQGCVSEGVTGFSASIALFSDNDIVRDP